MMPQLNKDVDDLVYFEHETDSGYFPSKRINKQIVPLGCYYKPENKSIAITGLLLYQLLPLLEMLETGIKTNFDDVNVHYQITIFNQQIKGVELYDLMHRFNALLLDNDSIDFEANLTVYCFRNLKNDVEIWKNTSRLFSYQEQWKNEVGSAFPVYGMGIDKEKLPLDSAFTIRQKRMTINRILFQLMIDYDNSYA